MILIIARFENQDLESVLPQVQCACESLGAHAMCCIRSGVGPESLHFSLAPVQGPWHYSESQAWEWTGCSLGFLAAGDCSKVPALDSMPPFRAWVQLEADLAHLTGKTLRTWGDRPWRAFSKAAKSAGNQGRYAATCVICWFFSPWTFFCVNTWWSCL